MAESYQDGSVAGGADFDLSQFYQIFFEEAGENLDQMEQMLLDLDLSAANDEELNGIFRCAHSIKGGAATFGFSDVAELTHQMESLLDRLRRHELQPIPQMVDVLLESVADAYGERAVALVLTGANSATGLRSMPARYVFLDEVDAYPGDVDGEGDPIALAEARTATFGHRKKLFLVSTPTIKGLSRIEREYEASDQRRYFVPCPHCGVMQWLQFESSWLAPRHLVRAV